MDRLAMCIQEEQSRRAFSAALAGIAALLVVASTGNAQALRKGVSVELAVTHHAVAMPAADQADAVIVAITQKGSVYFGITPITPAALTAKVKSSVTDRTHEKIYIKADARTPYARVLEVLKSARAAGVTSPDLLTGQPQPRQPGKPAVPMGLEVTVAPPRPAEADSALVQVLNSGSEPPALKINDKDVPWARLEASLRQIFLNRRDKVVVVKSDGQVPYSNVVQVIDASRAAGAKVVLAPPR